MLEYIGKSPFTLSSQLKARGDALSVHAAECMDRIVNENHRLRNLERDQTTPYFACKHCGHARTSSECPWCDRENLNELLRERTGLSQGEIDTLVAERHEK